MPQSLDDDTEYEVVLSGEQIEWLRHLVRGLRIRPGDDGDGVVRALELARRVE